MIKHGNIIVATDFSTQSDEALRQAVMLAQQYNASITLLHIMEPFMLYDSDAMLAMPIDDLSHIRRQGAQEKLTTQANAAGNDVTISTRCIEDPHSPAIVICETAKEMQADIIFVGRHGHEGFLEHLLVGSTAEHVVRHAPCTVVVTQAQTKDMI